MDRDKREVCCEIMQMLDGQLNRAPLVGSPAGRFLRDLHTVVGLLLNEELARSAGQDRRALDAMITVVPPKDPRP